MWEHTGFNCFWLIFLLLTKRVYKKGLFSFFSSKLFNVNYRFKIALRLVKYACVSTRLNYFLVLANIFLLTKKRFLFTMYDSRYPLALIFPRFPALPLLSRRSSLLVLVLRASLLRSSARRWQARRWGCSGRVGRVH